MSQALEIRGAGGGGKGNSHTPVEAANSLRSVAKAKILDLIAHGPIVGLVDGLKSVFLDDTPLQNADGSFNFSGVTVSTREGYPDQSYIPGFPDVQSVQEVATEVRNSAPVVRTVTNNDATAAVVTIQLQSLYQQTDQGDMLEHSVSVAIDVRASGGSWVTRVSTSISGKTTAPYQRSYRVPLEGNPPYDIRVRRLSSDSSSSKKSDKTFWKHTTEIVEAKLNYPDSALVGLELDSSLFGSQIPSRSYDVKLSIIKVPSNYNPDTREYTGIWDGTFKRAWTDNPAWIFYDLATDPVIGAGIENVDKWGLYRIGQYCDELVEDGYGGLEPRFTCNTLFSQREEAVTVLNSLASVFRGMCYWGSNTAVAAADMPADPVKLVTAANVEGGDFEYSGTSLRERHSVAIVMWNDPEDNYKAKPEIVEDPESIQLFGWRETQITAVGCTSRGQAKRLGLWALYSERNETETVTYTTSIEHADLRPGDFIRISDPDRAGARLGGRVVESGLTDLVLDKVPEEVSVADIWYLSVMMPSGAIERRTVHSFAGNSVKLVDPLSQEPVAGAVWVLSSAAVEAPMYRVAAVEESDGLKYKVTATEHDPNKYALVEQGLTMPAVPSSLLPTGPVAPPMDITVLSYKYLEGGTEHQAMTVGWTPSADVRTTGYLLELQGPDDVDFRTVYNGAGTAFDEKGVKAGQWLIRLKAVSELGPSSQWVARTVNIAGLLLPVAPDSVTVSAGTFSVSLIPRGAYPGATYEFWRSSVALPHALIESNATRLSVSTDLVDTNLRSGTTYFYYIRGANQYGLSAWYATQATTLEDFDDILDAVSGDIRRPGGLFEEMVGTAAQAGASLVRPDLDAARAELAAVKTAVREVGVGLSNLEFSSQMESIRHSAALALHEGASARMSTEETVRADENQALAQQVTTLEAEFDQNAAQVQQTLTALATADSTLAARVDTLEAEVGDGIQAAIADEALVRATADAALASRVTTLETSVGDGVEAAIQQEATARADADSALAQQITSLSASVDNQFASLSTKYSTKAYADGAVARAVTTATVNGKKAVFGISVDGQVAEIGAVADRFYVYNPTGGTYTLAFAVVNGQTVIRDALIRKGSIDTAKIADAAITMAKISGEIMSDNYVKGLSGWRLTRAGEFEINGQVAGQGRVKITNQLVEVFDSNGTRRVRMGIWT